ncbi:ribosome silencing factor [Candidatus Aerophobetes bacterium]|nr:ribosome silencing factor [Candidatus Aerophobetes bacterium]
MTSRGLALQAIKIAQDKKAKNVVFLNLKGISIITDYFLICSGDSSVHMQTIAKELKRKMEEKGVPLLNPSDFLNNSWILLDFGSVVVHIFSEETRQFYQLERLWADAVKENLNEEMNKGLMVRDKT